MAQSPHVRHASGMGILALIVLVVCAVIGRGGRHPRVLWGGIAYAVATWLLIAAVAASPRSTLTTGMAYGIPLAAAAVVAFVPWGRLRPIVQYPSGLSLAVAWVAGVLLWVLLVPLGAAIYMTWRYAKGYRSSPRAASAASGGAGTATFVSSPVADDASTKTCPDCAETILAAARICRFCRRDFSLVS